MAQELIFIGNKIELSLLKHGGIFVKEERPKYSSQFLQWLERSVAQIAVPMYRGQRIPMRVGDEYLLTFYTPKGLYRCTGIILEQSTKGQLPVASVRMSSELEKYQRRQFYRMECILPMNYAVLTKDQKKLYTELENCTTEERKALLKEQIANEKIEFFEGTVLDISGGGMRFNSGMQHQENDTLLLEPELPEQTRKKIPLLFARVISSSPVPYRNSVYDNRIEYVDISSQERETMICYIFQTEREKRKRELDY
ncbi:MAG: flagellar brake protein [Lachnospiraceae bacterium]